MIITDATAKRGNEARDVQEGDDINGEKFNRLPGPVTARILGGQEFWIETVDVQTGSTRLDVCGQIDHIPFSNILMLIDADGVEYDPDEFWVDYEPTKESDR